MKKIIIILAAFILVTSLAIAFYNKKQTPSTNNEGIGPAEELSK